MPECQSIALTEGTAAGCRLFHSTARRLTRVGAATVLEVQVTYPQLELAEGTASLRPPLPLAPAVARFHAAYRTAAEQFLRWAEATYAEAAKAAFAEAGVGAPYRFDRHLVICRMEASLSSVVPPHQEPSLLTVWRTVTMGTRRLPAMRGTRTGGEVWRWPALTVCRGHL